MAARIHNPAGMAPPMAAYSHAAELIGPHRVLHSAGQVGRKPDGTIPADFRGQAEAVWDNLATILAANAMTPADIVKINFFLTDAADVVANREVFTRRLGPGFRPTTTLLVIKALALPALKIEVEIVAAAN
jgi:enamine deaminase RidA (YjgF/YER057c/UK114 family)